jgi:hypothetical protein
MIPSFTVPAWAERALCAGKHELFDATDEVSHARAAAICRECPLMKDCAVKATTVEAPTGTWAARLHSKHGRPSNQPHIEDAMFTVEEARECYNAWGRGERTPLNKIGRRVHKRRIDAERAERREDDGTLRTLVEERYADEDAMFTDEEARKCATAYRYGDKTERNKMGQRVHKRRQRQARLEQQQRAEGAA